MMPERPEHAGNELQPTESLDVQPNPNPDGDTTGPAHDVELPAKIDADIVFSIILFVLAGIAFYSSGGWGEKAWFFPNILATGMILAAIPLGIQGVLKQRNRPTQIAEEVGHVDEAETAQAKAESRTRIIDASWFVALFFAYVGLLNFAGYIISTTSFFFVAFIALGLGGSGYSRRTILSLVGAAIATTGFVLAFAYGFAVPLPGG